MLNTIFLWTNSRNVNVKSRKLIKSHAYLQFFVIYNEKKFLESSNIMSEEGNKWLSLRHVVQWIPKKSSKQSPTMPVKIPLFLHTPQLNWVDSLFCLLLTVNNGSRRIPDLYANGFSKNLKTLLHLTELENGFPSLRLCYYSRTPWPLSQFHHLLPLLSSLQTNEPFL